MKKKTKKPSYKVHDYTDDYRVLRFDRANGEKHFRPERKTEDGWITGDPEKPLPLYKLDEIKDQDTIIVVEGEKCADAMIEYGFLATTSAHGAVSPHHTDWSPLVGKTVIIIPDNDEAGFGYRDRVAELLAGLEPSVNVLAVKTMSWGAGRDIADIVIDMKGAKKSRFRIEERIRGILAKAEPFKPPKIAKARRAVGRNNQLTREAGKLRDKGYGGEALERKLQDLNREKFEIPLPEEEVCGIAGSVSKYAAGKAPSTAEAYAPFPVDALPQPLHSYTLECARALGCDPAFVAVPLLVAAASAIGNTTRIQLKDTWVEPAILWAAIVGESGTLKSPAIEHALKFVNIAEMRAREAHAYAMIKHNFDLEEYELKLAASKKSKRKPPKEPEEPKLTRYVCSDITVEALAVLLSEQPRGLLVFRDELSGWIESFDRYASGSGDVAHWLSLFGGRTLVVDRKTGETRSITIPTASTWIIGGIQPGTLSRAIGQRHFDNGLLARVLLASPPAKQKRWTEAVIDYRTNQAMAEVFEGLYAIPMKVDKSDTPKPNILGFTECGKKSWVRFFDAHAEELHQLAGEEAAVSAKLEGYVARLALTIHMVRKVADEVSLEDPDAIDAASVDAAVELVQWFKREARRVYAVMQESEDQRETRRLIETVQRQGGKVSANDLRRCTCQFETSEDAEAALERLVAADRGKWIKKKTTIKGGRPTRVFKLTEPVAVTETPDGGEGGSGYGSAARTQKGGIVFSADMWRAAFKYNRRWDYVQKKGA